MKIDLVELTHPYSDPESVEPSHIYLSTPSLAVASRLKEVGIDSSFQDENIRPLVIDSEHVGTSLLGAPYIPEVIQAMDRIRGDVGQQVQFLFGGQVISGLSKPQFRRIFGKNAVYGNDDISLCKSLGVDSRTLSALEETSLISGYELVSDEDMKLYLSREISLYVSQGCKYACEFCAAVRSRKDPKSGEMYRMKEVYRHMEVIEKDLQYLLERARRLGLKKISLYLSNLDLFQTPEKLLDFARIVKGVRSYVPEVEVDMRGLATAEAFLNVYRSSPIVISEMVEAGLSTIGYGVDGITPEVWAGIKKGHNTEEKCIEAIRVTREDFGITPEALMVIGHKLDTAKSLQQATVFCRDMYDRYGAAPRPYVARDCVPGNDGWIDPKNKHLVDLLITHPELFQTLDYTALPSTLTHPDPAQRKLVSECYLKLAALSGCERKVIKAIEPSMDREAIEELRRFNKGGFDT